MLRRARLFGFFGLFLAAVPAAAQTQPAAAQPVGLSLGLRAGYALPGGNMGKLNASEDDDPLSDGVKGLIPFWLDLGYRITPHFRVGASLQYGFGLLNKDTFRECPDCSASVIAFGANAYLHGAPGGAFDPWAGLGIGYEVLTIDVNLTQGAQRVAGSATVDGIQYFVLQLGADVATGSAITVGPFFAVSMGKYGSTSSTLTAGAVTMNESRDLHSTSWHQWFTFGLQGQFNL